MRVCDERGHLLGCRQAREAWQQQRDREIALLLSRWGPSRAAKRQQCHLMTAVKRLTQSVSTAQLRAPCIATASFRHISNPDSGWKLCLQWASGDGVTLHAWLEGRMLTAGAISVAVAMARG